MQVEQLTNNKIVVRTEVVQETEYNLDMLLEQRRQILLDRYNYDEYQKGELDKINALIDLFDVGE